MVITTDLLVEGRHFRQDWSSAYDVGRKAAAQNLADIVAMGAVPTALVVGFGGARRPADRVGAGARPGPGGRVRAGRRAASSAATPCSRTRSSSSVTAFGALDGRAAGTAVRRAARRRGGRTRAGWAGPRPGGRCWRAGSAHRGLWSRRTAARTAVRRRPRAAARPVRRRCVDVSDGLLADLGHIAVAQSGVVIDVAHAGADRARAAAGGRRRDLGVDALKFVLTGGEDHALVGTFDRPTSRRLDRHRLGCRGQRERPAGTVTVDGAPYAAGRRPRPLQELR